MQSLLVIVLFVRCSG